MEVRRSDSELMHYGIMGMKWGVRRYQNADGSLTAAGKTRYTYNERKKSLNNVSNMSDDELKKSINRMNLEKTYRTKTQENLKDTKDQATKTVKTVGKIAAATAAGVGVAVAAKKIASTTNATKTIADSISTLSDSDLVSKISRLENEIKYTNLAKTSISNSKSTINKIIENAGETVLASAVAGTVAYALRTAITGSGDANTAANYIAPTPNKKKK